MKKLSTFLVLSLCALCIGATALGQPNYTFSSSSGTFTALSGASTFTWTTTVLNDEEYSSGTPIGFSFTFAGTAYTDFQASTNGFIRLGSTGLASATAADALSGVLRSIIAPLWDDLAVSATSADITYKLEGLSGSQILTVEWRNVKWNKLAGAANAEFQVKLYEADSKIEFIYGAMTAPNAGSASIGLADNTVISTAGSATGKFLSLNIGGTAGSRVYHQSLGYTFSGINNAPDANTILTFTSATPSAIPTGTYTIGGSSPTYNTLSDAATALNIHGVAGAVVLNVRTGTYDDIFHLIAVAGASATNTITLKNESGAVTLVPKNGTVSSTTGSSGADAIIRFDGTQYTTVQGLTLNDNGLATTVLKFEMGVCVGNSVLNGTMISGGRFNTFGSLTIDMKSTVGVNHAGSIGFRYFTSSSTEPDTSKATSYNRIENCTITGFWRAGWKNFGISGTNPDRGNVMTGCTLGDVSIPTGTGSDVRALEMDCQSGLTIENNTIQNIDVAIMTTNNIYGIWFNPAGSATNISSGTIIIRNNTINNLQNSGTGTTTGFAAGIACNNVANSTDVQVYGNKIYNLYTNGSTTGRAAGIGLFLSTGTPTTAKVYNNMISDIRAPRSIAGPATRGIDLQNGGGAGVFSVYYNSVYLDDATPPTATNYQSACLYFASFGTGTLDLRNNILINTMSTNGTGRAVALYASANSNLIRLASTTDYNNYYIGTGSTTRGVSTDVAAIYQTLADHQAAVATGGLGGPRDVNSKSKTVTFVSSADLHLSGGSIGDYDLSGIPVATYTTDIDGETRSSTNPYMGADEHPEAPLPIQLVSFTGAYQANGVQLNWRTLSEINNYGFEVQRSASSENGFASLPNSFIAGNGTTNVPHDYSYLDHSVQSGTWFYRLKQIDLDGTIHFTEPIQISGVTAVAENLPATFLLSQNYPNPFNPETRISYALAKPSAVTLTVYTVIGQEIVSLVNEQRSAGRYEVVWNATSASGAKVASGMYFYRIVARPADGSAPFTELKKMVLLK